MSDHQGCSITLIERHDCPPCPHGLVRGFEFARTDDEHLDDRTREMHLRRAARLRCSDRAHDEALAARRATSDDESPAGR